MLDVEKRKPANPQVQQTSIHRYLENFVLCTGGFKHTEDHATWEKNSEHYSREAALQKAWRERHKDGSLELEEAASFQT
jgi:hypothetical protein